MKRLAGVKVGSRASTEELVRFLDAGGVDPVIDRVFGFSEPRAAYEHLEAGQAVGKTVIAMD